MSYKNLQHYRHTVHRYLDAIWAMGYHKNKTRGVMYKILANRMNLPYEETHVKYFNRAQCKQAIKILRPMYIQLYGKDLDYKKEDKMYYSKRTINNVHLYYYVDDNKVEEIWNITVYCKSRQLDCNGYVADLDNVEEFINDTFNGSIPTDILGENSTMETIAKYIYEQVIPCYKVEIISSDEKRNVIYEEDD